MVLAIQHCRSAKVAILLINETVKRNLASGRIICWHLLAREADARNKRMPDLNHGMVHIGHLAVSQHLRMQANNSGVKLGHARKSKASIARRCTQEGADRYLEEIRVARGHTPGGWLQVQRDRLACRHSGHEQSDHRSICSWLGQTSESRLVC